MAGKVRSGKAITFSGNLNRLLPASLLKLGAGKSPKQIEITGQKLQKEEANSHLAL